jgi:hypothetical protein
LRHVEAEPVTGAPRLRTSVTGMEPLSGPDLQFTRSMQFIC